MQNFRYSDTRKTSFQRHIILRNPYVFPIILFGSLILGGLTGFVLGDKAHYLKPFGDIFLNLIFTTIVPLIFFSITSAIAGAGSLEKLGKIIAAMAIVFLLTNLIAAVYALVVVKLFLPAQGVVLPLVAEVKLENIPVLNQIASIFTVTDFPGLLMHEHMLALIVFSLLVGIAIVTVPQHGKVVIPFLKAGEGIFMRVFSLIMYYAPIGFFAYFAVLVSELGPKLVESYARITLIYYLSSLIFFIGVYTLYAYFAARAAGVKLFWQHVWLPATTAIATCSSAASLPANLAATGKMKVAPEIYETVLPLGTLIHKDGSVIGGVFKIAFLFGLFHLHFSGWTVLLSALGVSLLVGTVMGAIPSGGMLGELLIISLYGFPPSVLVVIAAISILIDPLATMLNVTGNTVASMVIAGRVGKRRARARE